MTRERLQTQTRRRGAPRGFSLIEVLVASAIFLLIMVAIYTVYQRALEAHKLGVNQADLIQSTRFGFEEMATRIRSAGFEFDLDGVQNGVPQQSDEAIEYMGERAIIVRANYDFASEALRGREPTYEVSNGVRVVTTGNDEILAFALGKDEGDANPPTETLQAWFDLDAPRNGIISSSSGEIEGEGLVEIPNVALTVFDDPPYTLYQFTWDDPSAGAPATLVRRPLVDNILDLRFEYFDEGGNQILPNGGGPNPASDGNPETLSRAQRADVRQVKISLKGMTPERDLRYEDPDDTNPITRKHRKFELSQEVHTFNVGIRGQKDEDLDQPEKVTDVQLCSGQCGMVRVDWKPGPPEDRISDHLVIIAECPNGTGPNYDQPLGSFLTVSDLDLTVTPEREYAVFDMEDNINLRPGYPASDPTNPNADKDVCARVIARDAGGAESEPADSDKNSSDPEPTANDYTTIKDFTRSEAPFDGQGSGYDSAAGNWPNAKADNGNSGVQITTDATLDHYPEENRITLQFSTPQYQLQRATHGGVAYDWTTDPNVSGYAALDWDEQNETCYRQEASPLDGTPNLRTPTEELARQADDERRNLYVFRVSGSDPSNWGPGQDDCSLSPSPGPNCVDDPRNFVPYEGNLLAYSAVSLAGTTFDFSDESGVLFTDAASGNAYDDRYLGPATWDVEPLGGERPLKSLNPGEVYYYRVRLVDYCWEDEDLDGVEDSTEASAVPVTAWATREDFASEDDWREAAIRLTPFYPPLNSQSGSGKLDLPATGIDDSDYVDLASLDTVDTYAMPGYAIPKHVMGNTYVRPEKPTEFYLARASDSGSSLLPSTDVNGDLVPESMGVRVVFNAAKRNSPFDTNGSSERPQAVGYAWYRLYRVPVNAWAGPGTPLPNGVRNFVPGQAGSTLVAEFRLSEDGLREYTIDRRSQVLLGKNSVLSNDALNLPTGLDDDGDPGTADVTQYHYYKLVTVQVSDGDFHDPAGGADDPLPPHVGTDGITPATTAARLSTPSRGFLFPSPTFYDAVAEADVTPTPPTGLNAQSIDVKVEMNPLDATCALVKDVRLLAYDYDDGHYLGTSDWLDWPLGSCQTTIGRDDILEALRGFPDRARFVVELSDVDEAEDVSLEPAGQRVRSDLLGASGDYVLNSTCPADCGDNANPGILGTVDDDMNAALDRIVTYDGDRVLSIQPSIEPCNTEDFSLLQIEVVLSGDVPNLLRTTLSGVRSGPITLPPPEFDALDGGLRRIRWFEGSFCDGSGLCDFPVVDADASELNLRLRFTDQICGAAADPTAVKVEEFNYRVLVDVGAGLEELLCSQRGDQAPDSTVDAPDYYCSVLGLPSEDCGRGPSTDPEPCGQNPDCDIACSPGDCPLNWEIDNDGEGPTVNLNDVMAGFENQVEILQREICSLSCNLDLTEIRVRFECTDDRTCSTDPLPSFAGAVLTHEFGLLPDEVLPPPTISYDDTDHVELTWLALTDLEVLPGEEVGLQLLFNGSMADTEITEYHMQFGDPLPSLADCDWEEGTPVDREAISVPNP